MPHYRLQPGRLRTYLPCPCPSGSWRKAAVLIPIQRSDQGDVIVFVVRSRDLRAHSGEIAFPGGALEEQDADLQACALREAQEEIGLDGRDLRLLGQLDPIVVAARYAVTPFVGLLGKEALPRPHSPETAAVLRVPVRTLLEEGCFGVRLYQSSDGPRSTYQFVCGETAIWGATARMLKRLLEVGYDAKFIE
jgi:8-oxo-dGTP pyrophosphatase MutT (NUDIX family)